MQRIRRVKIILKKKHNVVGGLTLSDFNTYYKAILIKIVLFYYKHVLVYEMSILVYLSPYIYTHTHNHIYIHIHVYLFVYVCVYNLYM